MKIPQPDLLFDLSGQRPCTLHGAASLAALCDGAADGKYGQAPVGRYNKSVGRVLGRAERYARLLRPHLRHAPLSTLSRGETVSSIADDMEGLIYACTEHAECVKGILAGCGISNKEKAFRPLFKEWKDATDLLDEMTNTMKHQEARCRFHTVQIRHGNNVLPLHGFFIEGYKDNSIGPHPVVHRNQPVYSVTWLAWAAVELVLALNQLMKSALLDKYGALDFAQTDRPELRSALKEAVRLPAYSFGEAHFLTTALPTFIVEEPLPKGLAAGQSCYGSIYYPWSHGQKVEVVGGSTMHMGDGQTKTFEIVSPERGVLINWNVARPSF